MRRLTRATRRHMFAYWHANLPVTVLRVNRKINKHQLCSKRTNGEWTAL